MDFYIFLANKCRAMEGELAHAELRSDSAILKKSTEGFFFGDLRGIGGGAERVRSTGREGKPRKARDEGHKSRLQRKNGW